MIHHMPQDAAKAHKESEQLLLACQKVGLFLHKFALLEHEMNERIVEILKLNDDAADVVARDLDFIKKWKLLETVVVGGQPAGKKKHVKTILNAISDQNNHRKVAAHCRFEPAANGSVQFRRTRAEHPLWTETDFAERFKKLDELRAALNALKPQLTFKTGDEGTSLLIRRYILDDEGPLGPTTSLLTSPAFPARTRPST
jgi:hypothetical protein